MPPNTRFITTRKESLCVILLELSVILNLTSGHKRSERAATTLPILDQKKPLTKSVSLKISLAISAEKPNRIPETITKEKDLELNLKCPTRSIPITKRMRA